MLCGQCLKLSLGENPLLMVEPKNDILFFGGGPKFNAREAILGFSRFFEGCSKGKPRATCSFEVGKEHKSEHQNQFCGFPEFKTNPSCGFLRWYLVLTASQRAWESSCWGGAGTLFS